MHPFTGLATREDGAIKICCRSHPIGFIQNESLNDVWNGKTMKQIRSQILNNQRPTECGSCWELEDQNIESLRQRHINGYIPEARINLYPDALSKLNEDFSMPFEIPTMELKLNNLCNLKCRMCNPVDSTSWNDWDKIESHYIKENNYVIKIFNDLNISPGEYINKFENNPNWENDFKKLLPHFRRIEFAGGEPLIDPQHYRILDMLAPYGNQIEVKYATNLTILGKGTRNIWQYWPKFKSIAVNVSIDGLNDSYEYIRGNADWNILINNIKEIQTIPNISRIVGAVAVQVNNVLILDKMIEYFLNELNIVFYVTMVQYPKVLCVKIMPSELRDEAINRLLKIKDKIKTFRYVKENPVLEKFTITQINNIVNFLRYPINEELWEECVEFNHKLDMTRQQCFEEINPEFKKYV